MFKRKKCSARNLLRNYPSGSRLRVDSICGCAGMRHRLYSLGLIPGTVISVVSNGHGPCTVCVRGATVALGRGMAGKVECSLVSEPGMTAQSDLECCEKSQA